MVFHTVQRIRITGMIIILIYIKELPGMYGKLDSTESIFTEETVTKIQVRNFCANPQQ
jgi:hypothetical protein